MAERLHGETIHLCNMPHLHHCWKAGPGVPYFVMMRFPHVMQLIELRVSVQAAMHCKPDKSAWLATIIHLLAWCPDIMILPSQHGCSSVDQADRAHQLSSSSAQHPGSRHMLQHQIPDLIRVRDLNRPSHQGQGQRVPAHFPQSHWLLM